jgi:hypothetical protein
MSRSEMGIDEPFEGEGEGGMTMLYEQAKERVSYL